MKTNDPQRKPDPRTEPAAWKLYWRNCIAAAQEQTLVELDGQQYRRIPFGEEDDKETYPTCPNCGCARGQLHVEACDEEQCPRCLRQFLSCDRDGDETRQ